METPKQPPTSEITLDVQEWSRRISNVSPVAFSDPPVVHLSHFNDFVMTDRANSWAEVQAWLSRLQGKWIYRGHSSSGWRLLTSLDRAITTLVRQDTGRMEPTTLQLLVDPPGHEGRLMQEFQRRAHHHCKDVPAADEDVDWKALMQHYGAPTSLLDWTHSPYVALFFAVENPTLDTNHSLWAIDSDWLSRASEVELQKQIPNFAWGTDFRSRCVQVNHLIRSQTNANVVVEANAFRMNERMAAQQGLFLTNLSRWLQLDHSLLQLMALPQPPPSPVVKKLEISPSMRISLLQHGS